jgi:PKD repeat protein
LVWHIYSQAGEYTVVLTVTDDAGNKGTTSKTVSVASGALTAAFTYLPASPVRGATVYFNGSSSSSSSGIASYAWTFGDGQTATGATPAITFACAAGLPTDSRTFVVSLTVKDAVGASATVAKEVVVSGCARF